ncbi:MAG TPA: polysaccharide deacetylase family protein [Friedmanniella sp.]
MRSRLPAGLKQTLRRLGSPVGSVEAVRTSRPEIVLTFDDGPDPEGTPAVLDALAAHGATATFFVLLTRVRRHPELLDRVRRAGHEIGLHGVDHQRLTRFSPAEARTRTRTARAELEERTGAPVRWFRPPYGALTPGTWLAVRRSGLVPVLWGPTTWDWRDVPQADRVDKAQAGARAGAVLLAHDAFAGVADGAADDGQGLVAPVVDRFDLVDRVLTAYETRGLRGRSLGDALTRGRLVRAARFQK